MTNLSIEAEKPFNLEATLPFAKQIEQCLQALRKLMQSLWKTKRQHQYGGMHEQSKQKEPNLKALGRLCYKQTKVFGTRQLEKVFRVGNGKKHAKEAEPDEKMIMSIG